jgi:hypothetical protein
LAQDVFDARVGGDQLIARQITPIDLAPVAFPEATLAIHMMQIL